MSGSSVNPPGGRSPRRRRGPDRFGDGVDPDVLGAVGLRSAASDGRPGRGGAAREWFAGPHRVEGAGPLPAGARARRRSTDRAKMPKPLSIEVETRLVFHERVLELVEDAAGDPDRPGRRVEGSPARARPRKVVRHVIQAAAALNGEIRPRATSLRPEVSLLVAERRRAGWSGRGGQPGRSPDPVRARAGGGRGRSAGPDGPPALGARWRRADPGGSASGAAMGISGYDRSRATTLDATLEFFDQGRGPWSESGADRGLVPGGRGPDDLRRRSWVRPADAAGSTGWSSTATRAAVRGRSRPGWTSRAR